MNTNTTRLSKVLDRLNEIADLLDLAPDGKIGLPPVWEMRDAWQDDPHASPHAELTVATRPDEARVIKILKYAEMPAYSQPERPVIRLHQKFFPLLDRPGLLDRIDARVAAAADYPPSLERLDDSIPIAMREAVQPGQAPTWEIRGATKAIPEIHARLDGPQGNVLDLYRKALRHSGIDAVLGGNARRGFLAVSALEFISLTEPWRDGFPAHADFVAASPRLNPDAPYLPVPMPPSSALANVLEGMRSGLHTLRGLFP